MPLSLSDLRAMVAAASTIPERLSGHFLSGQGNDEAIQARLHAWCQASAAGDWQGFQERLSWDGLDMAGAKRLLAPADWSDQAPLPGWTTTLQEALHLLEMIPGEVVIEGKGCWSFLDMSQPLPFEELLAPFVVVARRRFLDQSGDASHLLTDMAHLTLQRHLLQVLTSLSVQTFHAGFAEFRTQTQTTTSAMGSREQIDEQGFYRQFLQQMCQGGLAIMLRTYSVLARLLATTCDLWVEANVEFVQRLASDWSTVEQTFSTGEDLGQVSEIVPALSDTHAGRRCVMRLTFASGLKLIYKPRSVGMEKSYYCLLDWCNIQGATPPFKVLTILDRASYGWVEFVAHEPCQDQGALVRYYQRAGMLLCLVYVLGGVNCFYDHLIAHGEQPVLADASHLLHPYISPHHQHREGEDWEQAVYSVLHTGLLASWQTRSSRSAGDISGFGMNRQRNASMPDTRQAELSQPHLSLKYGSLKPRERLNIATCADTSMQLREEDLHEALCTGFQRMYQLLICQRAALLNADNPLQALKAMPVRIAYRERALYDMLLPDLLAPQALRDAVTRSMLLEQLGRDCVPTELLFESKRNRIQWWAVFAAERQTLLQGDIPVVSTQADSDALLIAPDQKVASYLCLPSFDLLLTRLEKLNEEDMHSQLALLRQVLYKQATPMAINSEVAEKRNIIGARPMQETLITRALAIADDIARQAVEIGENSVTWIDSAFSVRSYRYQLQPMRYGLARGASGIALFLAAVAKVTGIASYRRLALAAVQPLHRLLREESKRLAREMGLGAGFGLGSVVYALTRMSQFLDEPDLLADARVAARLITHERIADDEILDVCLGTAGAILGLLACYEVSQEQDLLDRAVWCGRHLLYARAPSKAGCRAWPTIGGKQTTGFAHGTAGIVYALLRLYAWTGDANLLDGAREGLHYEDHAFVHEKGNWAEEVGESAGEFGVSWCHGAPGIGLARIGGLPMLDTASIRQDIEIALQTTQQIGLAGLDHLCCGTCGRAEFLLTAARRLARPELADVAMGHVEQVYTRAEQRGGFALNTVLPRWVSHPQFFQGASGIGYTLLRMAQPDAWPSILLWE